jgi:putative oxidoreductase
VPTEGWHADRSLVAKMISLDVDALSPLVAALGRGLMALLFLFSAFSKLRDWSGGLAEVRAMGLPAPALALAGTVALQIGGGLMLAVGWHARWAALALAAFTLLATFMAHPFWRTSGTMAPQQRVTFAEHLAIVGGLLMVVAHG